MILRNLILGHIFPCMTPDILFAAYINCMLVYVQTETTDLCFVLRTVISHSSHRPGPIYQ